MQGFFFLAFALSALAAPQERAAGPSVTIKNGTIIGTSSGGVDSFKGIPFAQPPVGSLRLKPPQPLATPFGTINSQSEPTACPQFITSVDAGNLPEDVAGLLLDLPIVQAATKAGEDCLTLNVQRPSTATANSKLPVVFWIYGGGFELGSTQMYDGSGIVTKSVDLSQPIIYVAVNYRVAGFGFLAGDDLTNEGSTNLGLRDQRLGLQWVQDNIAAFGGDPAKVTIWGESAGSISVFDHTVINGGDNTYNGKPLFRAAIMDSGSVIPALRTTSIKAQQVYEKVLETAGCSSASDRLSCLRALDYTDFLNAVNSVPGLFAYQSINLAYLPRPDPTSNFFAVSPEVSIFKDQYTKVPIIIGDQEDEGPLFSLVQENVTTTNDLVNYLASFFPLAPRKTITNIVASYPDDPSYGSPFGTGPLYNIYPQYKRLAAILGDATFTLTRRKYLATVASKVPAWSYLATYFTGTPVLGNFHGSDLLVIYFGIGSPIAAESIKTYYISFVNNLNPNTISTSSPLIKWPKWTAASPKLLNFEFFGNSIIPDTFRQANYEVITSNTGSLRV